MGEVLIYTDGSCEINPGKGGYGAILLFGNHRKELSGGYRLTTNNRMEVMAAIAGLAALTNSNHEIVIRTDSQYLEHQINSGAATAARANGWRRSRRGRPYPNRDLWAQLLDLKDKYKVRIEWLRGHNGDLENERADQLAAAAIRSPNLLIDEEYERLHNSPAQQLDMFNGDDDAARDG